jgi:hypothetical protein
MEFEKLAHRGQLRKGLTEHYFKTKILSHFNDCLMFIPYGSVDNKHFCALK